MKKATQRRLVNIFLVAVLVFPTYAAHLFTPTAHAAETETNWKTLSDGGNEVNEVAEVDGEEYVRLGTGEGNGNEDTNAAYFQEQDVEAADEGKLTFTYTPETDGEESRVGFLPYYEDPENYALIGYNATGWYYEYKVNGEKDFAALSDADLPVAGESSEIVIDYDGLDMEVTIDDESAETFTFADVVNDLVGKESALRLGSFEGEHTQLVINSFTDEAVEEAEDENNEGNDDEESNENEDTNDENGNNNEEAEDENGNNNENEEVEDEDGNETPEKPDTAEDLDQIASDDMTVTIDKVFPRIQSYDVKGKSLTGQTESSYGLEVNGETYYPEVDYEKVAENEAVYTLEAEEIDATFTLSVRVEGRNVYYAFTDIDARGAENIETFNFEDLNFASITANEDNATGKFSTFSGDATKTGDREFSFDESEEQLAEGNYYVGVISNDGLAATMWSSSEVDGYGNIVTSQYETEDGVQALGIQSNDLYYHRSFMPEPSSNPAEIKIAIAEDENNDGKVDWQDGAIVYRDIMQDIKGAEDVNNLLGTRIAMNFGSQAPQPFLKTLDNIKKVALATDGLGQAVILKGYGNEGHDSAHPDYGDVGERMGGEEDLNLLIEEAHDLNTEIGVHINAQETYPEADAFNDDFIEGPDSQGWGWIDQAYVIDKKKDLASGTRQARLNELQAVAPGLDFVYLDVWYQDQWESNRIVEQFYDQDLRLATEFGTAMPNHATWTHWATDKGYGGKESKGINSDLMRFISNHQKDSFVLNEPEFGGTADNPLLGGAELTGFEGWQSDQNFDNFMHMTFNTNLATKFLQKYYVTNWEIVDGDKAETNLEKEIRLADPNGKDEVVVERKDDSRERIITLNDNVVLDGDSYLIPWKEEDFSGNSGNFEKLYHWNLEGGETTWTLPEELQANDTVSVYALTDQGRGEEKTVAVEDGQVTLTAEAETPYVVTFDDVAGPEITEWSTGAHVYDTGFNTATIDDEFTTVEGDEEAVSVERSNEEGSNRNHSNGDYYLHIEDPAEDTGITRTITDLEAGEDYVAEVYVENKSDEKASIQVTDAEEDVENYTLRSTQKNYVQADSHATKDEHESKMQRMQVSFTAESDTATLTLHREAGEGDTKFDDIRIVQKSLDNQKSDTVFEQDFETVVQGIYPFVIGNTEGVADNRIHLSEKNAPYTQKEWADNLIDDVIEGDWSVKVNTGNPGLLYRTIPQHLRFDEGEEYKVSFDYQTTGDHIRFISGDEEIDVHDIEEAEGLSVNESLEASTETKRAEFTVTGSENDQTYIGIFSDGTEEFNGHTKEGVFVLDNLRVEKITEEEPEPEPEPEEETAAVTVKYVTTDDEELDKEELGELEIGSKADIEAKEFDGYTLVEEPEDTTVKEGENVFTFVYEKASPGKDPGDDEDEKDNEEDGKNEGNDDTNDPSVKPDEEDPDKDEDGNELPKTATDLYNWLAVGLAVLLIGAILLFIRRKKVS